MSATAAEVWALLRELATAQQETDRRFKETDRHFKGPDRRFKQTDRQLKELGKQIGGLGEKFGGFTEGLALPSMERLLRQRFGMEVVSPSVRVSRDGRHQIVTASANPLSGRKRPCHARLNRSTLADQTSSGRARRGVAVLGLDPGIPAGMTARWVMSCAGHPDWTHRIQTRTGIGAEQIPAPGILSRNLRQ